MGFVVIRRFAPFAVGGRALAALVATLGLSLATPAHAQPGNLRRFNVNTDVGSISYFDRHPSEIDPIKGSVTASINIPTNIAMPQSVPETPSTWL